MLRSGLLIAVCLAALARDGSAAQRPFLSHSSHDVEVDVQGALAKYDDPVDAMLYLHPELKDELSLPRVLEIQHPDGQSSTEWMKEGDKMRLRRKGIGFIDWTDAPPELYDEPVPSKLQVLVCTDWSGTPNITHMRKIKPLFPHLSTVNLMETLERLTAYHNRFYNSESGFKSQRWLFDEITEVSGPLSFLRI